MRLLEQKDLHKILIMSNCLSKYLLTFCQYCVMTITLSQLVKNIISMCCFFFLVAWRLSNFCCLIVICIFLIFLLQVFCHIPTPFLGVYWCKWFVEMFYTLWQLVPCILYTLHAFLFTRRMLMPVIEIKLSRNSFQNIKFNFEGLAFMDK